MLIRMEWMAYFSSNEVYKILEQNPQGSIHSVFTNSFNIAFDKSLVHVGVYENGLAPFGIGLSRMDAQQLIRQIQNGQIVRWDHASGKLIFSNEAVLDMKQVKWTKHSFSDRLTNHSIIIDHFRYIADLFLQSDWQTGLAQTPDEKQELNQYLLSSTQVVTSSKFINEVNRLIQLIQGEISTEYESVFDYWMGRGLGLTPSGDDVLTGVCAFLSAFNGSKGEFQERLKSYLVAKGRQRTTHIAYEYLLYATNAKFHTHLIQMCKGMDSRSDIEFFQAVEEMKKIGHTSGADTLLGILLGIKALVLK
ncbi:DUF2877 domain-containing protein [Heyndrickxia oleronia]|uniref:DUF2877 domain-containing protein n=1 Tax=Heyndrickxia oleronia TaxID=38875 RepID=UPI001C0F2302|nr:DUF2877 domain-containing protein [Heyndrickxia oleronia]MBU5212127.1 DUF2877 domain-containing protein [Heyndrickxia oleronia]